MDVGTLLICYAIAFGALNSYFVSYGAPWQPQRLGGEPETHRDWLQRQVAFGVTIFTIVVGILVIVFVSSRA